MNGNRLNMTEKLFTETLNHNQKKKKKKKNGKQAGHFLQNGAIYKVFQEL